MVTFVMFKWYKLLHYKEIPPIYWMTLVKTILKHNECSYDMILS